ncbi:MAG TPA: radical SAM protein [Polyangiaceae bacterium]|nr:radical SAM protein [Polyangiaceae bacterium]
MSTPRSAGWVPKHCVWEITLACNARCRHCGSRAGAARSNELELPEALEVITALAELGCQTVTLSGGEPLLRSDWPELAAAITGQGMVLEMVTNGLVVAAQADQIAAAGFNTVTFSVDGTSEPHDRLRGVAGALERLLEGARALSSRGVRVAAATQINRENQHRLSSIHDLLVAEGFAGWQLQLTMAHGRVRDAPSLCVDPSDLPALEAQLCSLLTSSPLHLQIADNIGYMSRHEPRLRSPSGPATHFWRGCSAGLVVIGIRSNGDVAGCLSLPDDFVAGNVRERPLAEIWNDDGSFAYNRRFDVGLLAGGCADCAFGRLCRAGCRSLAVSASGHPFANPYCLHQVSRSQGPAGR